MSQIFETAPLIQLVGSELKRLSSYRFCYNCSRLGSS